jgi:hypothetical protein
MAVRLPVTTYWWAPADEGEMSEQPMVDRVADAIIAQFTSELKMSRFVARGLARAAIKAMRSPTDAMTEKGRWLTTDGPEATWAAMIDAALNEGQASS